MAWPLESSGVWSASQWGLPVWNMVVFLCSRVLTDKLHDSCKFATTSCRSELLRSTEQQASSVQVRLPGRQVRVKAAPNPTAKGPVQASEATFAPIFPGGQRQEWVPRVSFRAARMIPAHANWALPESFFAMPVIGESRGLGVLRGGRAGCSSLEKCAACPGCCR